jgi:hypothetical protein
MTKDLRWKFRGSHAPSGLKEMRGNAPPAKSNISTQQWVLIFCRKKEAPKGGARDGKRTRKPDSSRRTNKGRTK